MQFWLHALAVTGVVGELVAYESSCPNHEERPTAFTSFDSNLTTEGPLTWTVAASSDKDPSDHHLRIYWRDFYLSTPTSLNLSHVTDFTGCSIIFYNATAPLQVETSFNDYNSFSCSSVMSKQCQIDLMQQARDDISAVTNFSTFSCSLLSEAYAQRRPPQSCNIGAQQSTWGYTEGTFVAGRGLTPNATAPGVKCTTDNETARNDLIVTSSFVSLEPGSEESKAFQNGTTPVLTMFFNIPGAAESVSFLAQPEVHLNCLKTIPDAREQAKINAGERNASQLLAVVTVALVAVVFSLI